ncbi:MAG: glycosyltransferase family protein [Myxococcota bacterium]
MSTAGHRRIAYFVHGRGRGHAARARAITRRLEADGHALELFSGGDALELLGDLDVREVPIVGQGLRGLGAFPVRFAADRAAFRAFRPDLVISDSDAPSTLLGRALGLPVIALGHGLLFGHAVLPAGLPRAPVLREKAKGAVAAGLAWRKVIVNFTELPLATSDSVLARPDLRDGLSRSDRDEGFLLCYFRDANAHEVLRLLTQTERHVVCYTERPVPPGVERRPRSALEFADALNRCHAVVASAGNQLISESAMVGKPMFAVHARGDDEQAMNCALLKAAGLGDASPVDAVTLPQIERFLRMPRGPGDASRERLRAMTPVSEAIAQLVRAAPRCVPRMGRGLLGR